MAKWASGDRTIRRIGVPVMAQWSQTQRVSLRTWVRSERTRIQVPSPPLPSCHLRATYRCCDSVFLPVSWWSSPRPLEQWGQLNKLIHAQHLVQGRTHSRRLISARESKQRRPKRQQEKEPLISTEFQTTCFLLYPASTLPNVIKKAINTH